MSKKEIINDDASERLEQEAQLKSENQIVEVEEEQGQIIESGKYIPRMTLKEMKVVLQEELEKREYLLDFIKKQLIPGIDFGMIHKKNKDKSYCEYRNEEVLKDGKENLIWQCPDCKAKYELRKPGAEKICGFLQLKPKFEVDKDAMDALGMVGKGIIYICYLIAESGKRANEGYEGRGARTLGQDYNDLNKCVKMAKKSAHIDATLTIKGLSAIFTQDITDIAKNNPKDWEEPKPEKSEFGTKKDGYKLPNVIEIKVENKSEKLTLTKYFVSDELSKFKQDKTPLKKIGDELEHRHNFVYVYSPKSPLIFSQLSKMKAKIKPEEWKEWKETAKKSDFKKEDSDRQLELIAFFAMDTEDPTEALERKDEG